MGTKPQLWLCIGDPLGRFPKKASPPYSSLRRPNDRRPRADPVNVAMLVEKSTGSLDRLFGGCIQATWYPRAFRYWTCQSRAGVPAIRLARGSAIRMSSESVVKLVQAMPNTLPCMAALQPIEVNGDTAEIGVSIDVAFSQNTSSPQSTFRRPLTRLMYAAKAAGKNCFCVFEGSSTHLPARRYPPDPGRL